MDLVVDYNFLEFNNQNNAENSISNFLKINYPYICYTNMEICMIGESLSTQEYFATYKSLNIDNYSEL
jgi:hypothetical protein